MRYLGLDLGTKTLGLALSDKTATIASYYANLHYSDEIVLIENIKRIADKEKVSAFVLGLPKNMDNTHGFRVNETLEFKKKLEKEIGKQVILEDERLTTILAEKVLIDADVSRKKRKQVKDGLSAVIILQSYLDRKDN